MKQPKLIKDILEEIQDIPVCPQSREVNIYYLFMQSRVKGNRKEKESTK